LDVDGESDFAGKITLHGDADLKDNGKLLLGTGDDLQIYHDGNNSLVKHLGTGDLYIQADNGDTIYLRPRNNENGVKVIPDGAVELYYDNTKRFETLSNGGKLTGRFYLNGSNGAIDYNNTAHTLEYIVNGSAHSELTTNAFVPATSGSKHLGIANKRWNNVYANGILFNGDSAAANTLSDYEEGTYTPISVGANVTLNVSTARYTKIGNRVWVDVDLGFAGNTNGLNARISLPFAMNSGSHYGSGIAGWADNSDGVKIHVGADSAYMMKIDNTSGGNNHLSFLNMSNKRIIAGFYYETA